MVLGVDLGYSFTKDSNGHRFKSALKYGNHELGGIKLEFDDKQYTIGVGHGTVDENKTMSEVNQLCMLTVLGLNGSGVYHVVAGLPISHFKAQKESFKNQLLKIQSFKFKLNDETKIVSIYDAMIFPECLGALFSLDIKQDVILVDVGGRTTDICYVDFTDGKPQLGKRDTLYYGTIKLDDEIMEVVNSKYEMSLPSEYAENIMRRGLSIHGEPQNLEFLVPVFKNYIHPIVDKIKIDYPHKSTKILLCGGGAEFLSKALKNHFTVEVMPNPQFSNAMGFYAIAQKQFGGRNERVHTANL